MDILAIDSEGKVLSSTSVGCCYSWVRKGDVFFSSSTFKIHLKKSGWVIDKDLWLELLEEWGIKVEYVEEREDTYLLIRNKISNYPQLVSLLTIIRIAFNPYSEDVRTQFLKLLNDDWKQYFSTFEIMQIAFSSRGYIDVLHCIVPCPTIPVKLETFWEKFNTEGSVHRMFSNKPISINKMKNPKELYDEINK